MSVTGQGIFLSKGAEADRLGAPRTLVAGLVRIFGVEPKSSSGVFILSGSASLIGRDEGADFQLRDPSVSRRHAIIERSKERFVIRDLGSSNGTFINGRRIHECELLPNDRVRIGDTLFRFTDRGAETHEEVTPEHRAARILGSGGKGIIGGVRMELLGARIERIAPTDLTVAIEGESGTGKELVARSIHEKSGRRGEFVAINCAALAPSLIEAELFGVKRGAFTGADRDRDGLIRTAHGGTLFLDEIGDMPLEAQAKLLRVLQEREVLPLGGTRAEKVDVRIVSATHRDLEKLVESERFRGDLWARLKEASLRLPPLRERIEDLIPLITYFLAREGVTKRAAIPFLLALAHYPFPYNVRELESAIKVAIALSDGDTLELSHLPFKIQRSLDDYGKPPSDSADNHNAERREARRTTFAAASPDRQTLIELLVEHEGNISSLARAFGKQRMQIHRWLKKYEIDPERYRKS